jgi:Uma2 family endonuclease
MDMFPKLSEYLLIGVRFVVLIDPGKSTVSVYHGSEQEILSVNDTLTLPDVLPGFAVPVARLFA